MRIRHFGLLANRHRKQKLQQCRSLLGASPPLSDVTPLSIAAIVQQLTGRDLYTCPFCQRGTMRVTESLPPTMVATVPVLDTS